MEHRKEQSSIGDLSISTEDLIRMVNEKPEDAVAIWNAMVNIIDFYRKDLENLEQAGTEESELSTIEPGKKLDSEKKN